MAVAGFLVEDVVPEDLLHTVRVAMHVDRAMTKLHARGRGQLVVRAYESGLVTPGG